MWKRELLLLHHSDVSAAHNRFHQLLEQSVAVTVDAIMSRGIVDISEIYKAVGNDSIVKLNIDALTASAGIGRLVSPGEHLFQTKAQVKEMVSQRLAGMGRMN